MKKCKHDLYRKYSHLPMIRVCRDCGDHFSIRETPPSKPVQEERDRSVQAVMDLYYALKEIDGTPTLKDLVKLAKRIRKG